MFKGACRLDDPAHRTIIFVWPRLVKKNRPNLVGLRLNRLCPKRTVTIRTHSFAITHNHATLPAF